MYQADNTRRRAFVRGLFSTGGIPSISAGMAGYNPSYGFPLTRSASLREKITKIMDAMGISDRALMRALKEGLTSMWFFPQKEGEPLEKPDFRTRHTYLETGLKLKGHLGPETQINVGVGVANVESMPTEQMRLYVADRLKTLFGSSENVATMLKNLASKGGNISPTQNKLTDGHPATSEISQIKRKRGRPRKNDL